MPCTRQELEERERQFLAPFAKFSAETRGRKYAEEPPEWRTHYQRDRDRVIHSRAFRRLEYKTQVFLNGSGDHLRTRLTHTMEVAAIARNVARALKLNEELAETIALAHDLGHSPFGHKGEMVLDKLMKDHGGFEHNRQSLRVVEELEQKYPGFPGLNLSWEVREGLAKHETSYDLPSSRREFEKEYGELPDECRWYFIIRCIIDGEVRDVVETTEKRILASGVKSADEVRKQTAALAAYSSKRRELNLELRDYLYENLYYNPVVHEPNQRAVRIMEQLFAYYLEHPQEIGAQSRKRIKKIGLHRAVCDYIAGMTDRYVLQEHNRVFGLRV